MPATAGAPLLLRRAAPSLRQLGVRRLSMAGFAAPCLLCAPQLQRQQGGASCTRITGPSYARHFSSAPRAALPASAETQSYRFK